MNLISVPSVLRIGWLYYNLKNASLKYLFLVLHWKKLQLISCRVTYKNLKVCLDSEIVNSKLFSWNKTQNNSS